MNHWVSKEHGTEECGSCGTAIPNASGQPGVQVSGICPGWPNDAYAIYCQKCVDAPPLRGRYSTKELERHEGFCERCKAFVGDRYLPVDRKVLATLLEKEVEYQAKLAEAAAEQQAAAAQNAPPDHPQLHVGAQNAAERPLPSPELPKLVVDETALHDARVSAIERVVSIGFLLALIWFVEPRLTGAELFGLLALLAILIGAVWLIERRRG